MVAVFAAVYFAFTRTALTKWIVLGRLGQIIHADIGAEVFTVDADGLVIAENLRIRSRDLTGMPGELFHAKRLEARVDLGRLLLGRVDIASVMFEEPLLRISQSSADGSLNFAGLRVPEGGGGSMSQPPRITLYRGVIEIGEHRATAAEIEYRPLRRVDVAGEVQRAPDEAGDSVISFRQVEPGSMGRPLAVQGRVGSKGLSLSLDSVRLSDLSPETVPSSLREAFRQLGLEGRIDRITFNYLPSGRVEARMQFNGVGVNLPIEPLAAEDAEGRPIPLPAEQVGRKLRLLNTSGSIELTSERGSAAISGRLTGAVEDLPYEVVLSIEGTSTTSPFTVDLVARNFELKSNPQIMRYTPGLAQRRLAQFSNPEGIVDAEVKIRRGPPVQTADGPKAGPIDVSGRVIFRDGNAAYERFPYRFYKMTGEWRFDSNRLEFVDVKGTAPSGAKVVANGWIAPLTETAGCSIDVRVTDLPVDETLERSMGVRKRVVEALFNRGRYQELLDLGLITTEDAAAAARRRLADLEARAAAGEAIDDADSEAQREILARPVFEMGGRASVHVKVQRREGVVGDVAWTDSVVIDMPEAQLVPERFAYPVRAQNIRIIKNDNDISVTGGPYFGLRGGSADIKATADLQKLDDVTLPFAPDVEVFATDVPVDDLFINAIPSRAAAPGERSVHDMLRMLNIDSTVDCRAKIGIVTDAQGRSDIGVDVGVSVRNGFAAPTGPNRVARLVATGLQGQIQLNDDKLSVELRGQVAPATSEPADPAASTPADVTIAGEIDLPTSAEPDRPRPIRLAVAATNLDVTTAVEDLVGVFTPSAGEAIAAARSRFDPEGVIDLSALVVRREEEPVRVSVESQGPEATFRLGDLVLGLRDTAGAVKLNLATGDEPGIFEFRDFAAELVCDGEAVGRVVASGVIGVDGRPTSSERLRLKVTDGRFESALVPRILRDALGRGTADLYANAQPRGRFDADLTLTLQDDGAAARAPESGPASASKPASASAPRRASIFGVIEPRSLAFRTAAGEVTFGKITGRIELPRNNATAGATPTGEILSLICEAPAWTVRADGSWHIDDRGRFLLRTDLGLDSTGVPPDLRAVLPAALIELIDDLKLQIRGPLAIRDTKLSLILPGPDASTTRPEAGIGVKTSGRVSWTDASLDVGIGVSGCDAVFDFAFDRVDPARPANLDLRMLTSRFTAAGVNATDGRVRIASGPDGAIYVPHMSAASHGGRLAGTATILPPGRDGRREYTGELRLSDVRFAGVIQDLKRSGAPGTPTTQVRSEEDLPAGAVVGPPPQLDESRGRLDAQLAITGIIGDIGSRRGRGEATVGGEQVVNVPLVIPLVRLSNLELPISERLDFARAEFFTVGQRVKLEQITVSSASVDLYGYGTADLPNLELDLRFRARNKMRIPLVSGLVERIRNELLTAEVRGTLNAPDINLVGFSATTRFIDRAFGGEVSDRERRLDEIESQAARLRTQLGPVPGSGGRGVPAEPAGGDPDKAGGR